ncbi:hypothetical protein TNIN_292071 [Trichonephila inaurata madagascariensis]|uniref:Uncharacterized protein n=1 Tax=Trichonephila inaurata madagascariensis TaxID=2747483 RepID=A0A8X6WY67_9ARAC|nr:hypothetical protein TNIN_292071 [Trichonephila inaurata madagascariensis]
MGWEERNRTTSHKIINDFLGYKKVQCRLSFGIWGRGTKGPGGPPDKLDAVYWKDQAFACSIAGAIYRIDHDVLDPYGDGDITEMRDIILVQPRDKLQSTCNGEAGHEMARASVEWGSSN